MVFPDCCCRHSLSTAFRLQIIAVHADDPEYSGFDDISQIPKHRLAEIKRL